ncbi:CDP-diacylglycerol--glycerol-3-phosphate 3-phosphatidyltransferase [Lactobacillus sp. S2-2]|uniref:CDP-diacylglycerol--glycerol-3-phosphate 3-phosphatidyltransferase n=1 Tax=Lactobacillus sp. S2-2 TaxID=2692917 RepID=UPI001F01D043|nr:CDP-diacylglycerol--glycerol-3-phosphate 3-phosphatidyltransferase [Lactobacillus sp. S2-2]MCF6515798.1 CDP-diacylglycerol--glycerol-3-phosphate 3-phosphatidyltransferase [Lactobacillus sp. S2-2]
MNLPNKLTVFRIFLIPVFLLLVSVPMNLGSVNILNTLIPTSNLYATVVFVIACLTDFLDGQIARKNNLVTNFGKFADPMADKLLVMTALVYLTSQNIAPFWVVVIIIARELAVTGLRLLIVENNGKVLAAAWPGKIKTFTQMFAIIILMLNNVLFNNMGIQMGLILLYICLIFTVYSGYDYFKQNKSVFSDSFN